MGVREIIRKYKQNLYKRQNRLFLIDVLLNGIDFSDVIELLLSMYIEGHERKNENITNEHTDS